MDHQANIQIRPLRPEKQKGQEALALAVVELMGIEPTASRVRFGLMNGIIE